MMNLIVTCARHLEGETEDELIDILEELGDSDVKISVSSMSGIITVQTKLEPIEVVRKMKEILLDEPWSVRYCLRVIPIQKTVETNIERIETGIPMSPCPMIAPATPEGMTSMIRKALLRELK